MKHSFFAVALSVLVLSGALVGCQKDEPVGNTVPMDNEFALVKYSVGKSYRYFKESAGSWGLVPKPNREGRFLKQENGYNKEFSVWTIGYDYNDTNVIYEGSLYVNVQNFDTMKSVFKRWLAEFRAVTNLKNMVRVGFSSSADNVKKSYEDFDSFMADVDRLQFQNELSMYAQLVENNGFEYHFTFCWRQYVKGLEVQVSNRLALRKEPELPMVDSIVGKENDILVMKVDYMTFKFMGYSTVKIADALSDADTIPFCTEYKDPCDFGYIKLYYGRKDSGNLLFNGSIVWAGCGKMEYPKDFVTCRSNMMDIIYPGQSRFSFFDGGSHYTVTDEYELKRIWQTITPMEAFQWYYGRTAKKVAVYLYTPSVGMGDPADGYYLVFVENSRR